MTAGADSHLAGRWKLTFAVDIAFGDKIRMGLRDVERRVVWRSYTDYPSPTFQVRYDGGGEEETLAKLRRIRIWDEDCTVTRRVQVLTENWMDR